MKSIILGTLLVVFIILFSVIIYFIFKAKKKVEEFSREAFGTSSITEGLKQAEQEYNSTPKSVSAMTSLYLPKIKKDFPDFSYDEMKSKANNVLTSYLLAINAKNVSLLQEGNSELKHQLENHILQLSNHDATEHFEQVHIHRMELSDYRKANGRCIITFQASMEYVHYVTKEGQITSGTKEHKIQTRYETDLIYIQDRDLAENDVDGTLGLNCPNCGAAIKTLGSKSCPYCGTAIQEWNIHAWSFDAVREK